MNLVWRSSRPLQPLSTGGSGKENRWIVYSHVKKMDECMGFYRMSIVYIHCVFFSLCPDTCKVNKKKGRHQQTASSAAAMLPVSTNRQGVTKPIKRLQSRMGSTSNKATVKNKTIKCALGQSAYCLIKQRETHTDIKMQFVEQASEVQKC